MARCGVAFVTFEHEESAFRCLDDYRASKKFWTRSFQPAALRFRGAKALRVGKAPAPSNIIWENLEHGVLNRMARRALSTAVTTALLLISFLGLLASQVRCALPRCAARDCALLLCTCASFVAAAPGCSFHAPLHVLPSPSGGATAGAAAAAYR